MKDLIIERYMCELEDGSRECNYVLLRDGSVIYNGNFKGLVDLLTVLDEDKREPTKNNRSDE